ncbi:CpaF family protein [Bifidobacterium sp.]|jgi:pilus assembly protein CpaF|uniref:CpaF family protein n=1 Tax=Bifidobacterium sp. TaxID=41200 RepID=UPI0025BB5D56|nr:ATPase, T2SS/T4P/T4SS family [Bifidobacterium sp.]MCH4209092.1 Flp pilus assembly complex ATPase component TadA [Bifidobacterium sp.]MCI1224727.1 Flp pilus assembly complex ATPase component TadA [Bifidobacterium sp.]
MTDELMLGPLQDMACDPALTDLAVTGDGRVWADYGDGMVEAHPSIPFRSPDVIREYAVRLCAQLGCRLDDACPIGDASGASGIRVHAVIAPIVTAGAAISIRLPKRGHDDLRALRSQGLFPKPWLAMLLALVRAHASILITGGTGAGKTTLLKALLETCDPAERIVSVEEVRELGSIRRDNHVSLLSRAANVEGAGAIGLGELVKATLRMRPDRVILGECRGEEIADLLRAFNSGHRGGMATLHADSVERVPARLTSLGLLAGLSPQTLAMLAENAFDVVVHVQRARRGRCISQIGDFRVEFGVLTTRELARWDGRGPPIHTEQWREFARRWMQD